MRTATWHVTDTMAVPVDVLSTTNDGKAKIRSSSGEKTVRLSELTFDTPRWGGGA